MKEKKDTAFAIFVLFLSTIFGFFLIGSSVFADNVAPGNGLSEPSKCIDGYSCTDLDGNGGGGAAFYIRDAKTQVTFPGDGVVSGFTVDTNYCDSYYVVYQAIGRNAPNTVIGNLAIWYAEDNSNKWANSRELEGEGFYYNQKVGAVTLATLNSYSSYNAFFANNLNKKITWEVFTSLFYAIIEKKEKNGTIKDFIFKGLKSTTAEGIGIGYLCLDDITNATISAQSEVAVPSMPHSNKETGIDGNNIPRPTKKITVKAGEPVTARFMHSLTTTGLKRTNPNTGITEGVWANYNYGIYHNKVKISDIDNLNLENKDSFHDYVCENKNGKIHNAPGNYSHDHLCEGVFQPVKQEQQQQFVIPLHLFLKDAKFKYDVINPSNNIHEFCSIIYYDNKYKNIFPQGKNNPMAHESSSGVCLEITVTPPDNQTSTIKSSSTAHVEYSGSNYSRADTKWENKRTADGSVFEYTEGSGDINVTFNHLMSLTKGPTSNANLNGRISNYRYKIYSSDNLDALSNQEAYNYLKETDSNGYKNGTFPSSANLQATLAGHPQYILKDYKYIKNGILKVPSGKTSHTFRVCSKIEYNNRDNNNQHDQNNYSEACVNITVKKGSPPPPPGLSQCPRPPADYFSSNDNRGYTYGASYSKNLTSSVGWYGQTSWGSNDKQTVWAKPSDSIQFMHCFYPGAQAVRYNERMGRSGLGIYSYQGVAQHSPYTYHVLNSYTISASPSSHFFGNSSYRGSQSAGNKSKIETFSPSNGNRSYGCNHSYGESLVSGGYQVRGKTGCSAVSASDLGKTISQTQSISGPQATSVQNEGRDTWYASRREVFKTCYKDPSGNPCTPPAPGAAPPTSPAPVGPGKPPRPPVPPKPKPQPQPKPCYKTKCFDHWHYYNNQTRSSDFHRLIVDNGYVPSTTASVKVPYNYYTEISSKITTRPVSYLGEQVDSKIRVDVKPRKNPDVDQYKKYATATVPETKVRIIKFIVPARVGKDSINLIGDISKNDPCSYYRNTIGSGLACNTIKEESRQIINQVSNLNGGYKDYSISNLTPNNVEVGAKYCVAAGVYPADSHDMPNDKESLPLGINDKGYGMNKFGNSWRISNASCITIAKKPNLQVWGAGVYSAGGIKTSLSFRNLDSTIYNNLSLDGGTMFGSWGEHEAISNQFIRGFASGTSLGYSDYYLKKPGGVRGIKYDKHCENLSPLSVANNDCSRGVGKSNIDSRTIDNNIERIFSYYHRSNLNALTPEPSCSVHNSKCYRINSSTIFAKLNHGTLNKFSNNKTGANETMVIYYDGTLKITGDITYADSMYKNIFNLPQTIIIANNIEIAQDVKRIDAWLIAKKYNGNYGNITTCNDFKKEKSDAEICSSKIKINGPIFASKLITYRTHGADGGNSSIDPGEIFDLRSDAFLWSANQASRSSQAVITYKKEIAPRY